MKARLMFVPPGGGEIDYALDFDLPAVPQPGDYITVTREDASEPRSSGWGRTLPHRCENAAVHHSKMGRRWQK